MSYGNFAQGLVEGWETGSRLQERADERRREKKLREETTAILNESDIPVIDPLTGKQTGYKLGDRIFTQRPDSGLVNAHRYRRLARAQGQYGDPDKAVLYDAAGLEAETKFLDTLARRALASGDLDAIIGAYGLVPDGRKIVRRDSDKGVELWVHPEGAPDQAELYAAGNPDEIVQRLAQEYSPEAAAEWAKASFERQKAVLDMRHTRAKIGKLGIETERGARDLAGIPTSFNDRFQQDKQQIEYLKQQVEMWREAAQNDPNKIPYYEQALGLYQQAMGVGVAKGGYEGLIDSLVGTEADSRLWRSQNNAPGAGGLKGHYGRLQFGHARLAEAGKALGVNITPEEFMANPELQQQVERWHFADIDKQIAARGLERYIGMPVGGAPLTMNGLRAMAHLGGVAGTAKYLEGGAKGPGPNDGRTSLSDYARIHGGAPETTPALPQAAQGLATKPAESLMAKIDTKDVDATALTLYQNLLEAKGFSESNVPADVAAQLRAQALQGARAYHLSIVTGKTPQGVATDPQAEIQQAMPSIFDALLKKLGLAS